MSAGGWVIPTPGMKYGPGMNPPVRPSAVDSPLSSVAVAPAGHGETRVWHPGSGLFWFGAIAAAAVGLMGASTHVRVGPARVGADLGKD